MDKWKFTEIVLMAISAIIAAAKAVMKIVSYYKKARPNPAPA